VSLFNQRDLSSVQCRRPPNAPPTPTAHPLGATADRPFSRRSKESTCPTADARSFHDRHSPPLPSFPLQFCSPSSSRHPLLFLSPFFLTLSSGYPCTQACSECRCHSYGIDGTCPSTCGIPADEVHTLQGTFLGSSTSFPDCLQVKSTSVVPPRPCRHEKLESCVPCIHIPETSSSTPTRKFSYQRS